MEISWLSGGESLDSVEAWIAVSWGDCNIVSCSNRVWSEP